MSFYQARSSARSREIPVYIENLPSPHKKWLPITFGVALGILAAQDSAAQSPTVYGKFNITLDRLDYEGASRTFVGQDSTESKQWELNSNASRLGVKGELAVGEAGLTAVYLAEYETDVDDGSTPFNQRNIYLGLQGGFGRVIGGRFDTPLKVTEGRVDQFNDLRADIDFLAGGQNRASNILQYSSPKINQVVTANFAVIPAEGNDVDLDGDGDDALSDTLSASLTVDNGRWYGALAYETNQSARRSLDGIVRAHIIRAVGTVKLAAFELGALIQQANDVAQGSEAADTSYLISGGWNIAQVKLKAQYGLTKAKASHETGRLVALGADYGLGARTKIFTYVSALEVDTAELIDNTFAVGVDQSF